MRDNTKIGDIFWKAAVLDIGYKSCKRAAARLLLSHQKPGRTDFSNISPWNLELFESDYRLQSGKDLTNKSFIKEMNRYEK